jgi:uncharacterized membrane protein HdeD (DUF308 family)
VTIASSPFPTANDLSKSRFRLILGGVLFIFVGISAIASPLLYSLVLSRFLAMLALVSGVLALGIAVFGKTTRHRVIEALSGIIRIAAGIVLLNCLATSVAVITLIFAIFLIVEGVFLSVAAFTIRSTPGWVWQLISGLGSLFLGVIVYNHWPSDSIAILGLYFGITLLLNGSSLLALGLSSRKPATA